MAKRRRKGIPGVSFSPKRALGVSSAKRKISKYTGVPLTRAGRQRKVGKMMGCAIPMILMIAVPIVIFLLVF